jgi:acyl dehydratase
VHDTSRPSQVANENRLHHEDLVVGTAVDCGSKTVLKDEIIAFGRAWDPQPLHVDEEAAKATLVGGLCASGWHTCCIMMRLVADGMLNRVASLGAPGLDEGRWMVPVRPGDVVSCRYTVLEKRDLRSRPQVGIAKALVELFNQNGEAVANWRTNQLTRRRHPGATADAPAAEREPQGDVRQGDVRQGDVRLWESAGGSVSLARPDLYFEDRQVGELTDFGSHTFAREEIVAFAGAFDPQPFHLDEAAAKASLFGALCASGWHTVLFGVRGHIRSRLEGNRQARAQGIKLAAYGPSPGFRGISWFSPVYVGDTLTYRGRLAAKIDLKSRPGRGLIATEIEARNQKGESVLRLTSQILAERREPYRPQ